MGKRRILLFSIVVSVLFLVVGCIPSETNTNNQSSSLKWRYETDGWIDSSPAIGSDGTIYVGSDDSYLYAIQGESEGLADTPWPKFRKNNRNTGNYDDAE
jgi:outer membrane protein assembly factor BamB